MYKKYIQYYKLNQVSSYRLQVKLGKSLDISREARWERGFINRYYEIFPLGAAKEGSVSLALKFSEIYRFLPA